MTMLLVVLELKLLFCFIVTPPRRAGAQVRLVSVAHTRTVGLAPLLGQRHCLLLAIMWSARVKTSQCGRRSGRRSRFMKITFRFHLLEVLSSGGVTQLTSTLVTEKNKAVLYTPMSRLYTLYRL